VFYKARASKTWGMEASVVGGFLTEGAVGGSRAATADCKIAGRGHDAGGDAAG